MRRDFAPSADRADEKSRPYGRLRSVCVRDGIYAYLNVDSSETVSFLRPLARRAASTLRPFAVAIRARKPCLLILFRREGW